MQQPARLPPRRDCPDPESLRLAIQDLMATYPARYPNGQKYLTQLDAIQRREPDAALADLARLRADALLANPLLEFDRLLLLKRKRGQLGLPTNHQCNPSLKQRGYDNEIAVLDPVRPGILPQTLFRPADGAFVGEIDLHFDADRMLFTMPSGGAWQIHELKVDGTGLRQVSPEDPDVDNFDPCYLPDGRIVFASTASFTGVPCWHGQQRACCLYTMNADGSEMRQLCFDQDLDLHPSVLANGQVVYSRWDYTGIMHVYLRPLMAMNPDGTQQRAIYGSNSYYPNSLFFPKAIPGSPTRLAAILAGYHGPNRMGELVVLDTARGWHEADGILHRIGHRGEPIVPVARDNLIGDSWPKFLHPFPLSDKYFLAAAQVDADASWGIYLVDVFDNLLPLALDESWDYFEPLAVQRRERPPVLPDRVDPRRDDATIYLHDVYAGPGLAGVPRGLVKRLRIAAYHYGYPGMAGPDKIGRAGPWEAMRILGTVPVQEDGSASFRVPAGTPISIQPLDPEGKALAVMRSWYTAMPGERAACVGCHEAPDETPLTRQDLAALLPVAEIEPWRGAARGFDFEREVQPVLDRYCVGCHDGADRPGESPIPDLRGEQSAPGYRGLPLSKLGASRLAPELRGDPRRFAPHTPEHKLMGDRRIRYTPAYDVLIRYIRRVNIEDYVGLQVAGEYHADTSELVQMLKKGHHNVQLDAEAWDRIFTWIDLNGPCHGTWGDVAPIPGGADRQRRELALKYGGPKDDPERVVAAGPREIQPVLPEPLPERARAVIDAADWPLDPGEARRRQLAAGPCHQTIDLGAGVKLEMVRIPAGRFVMGSDDGPDDESPTALVTIPQDFWISSHEVTNQQFRRFAPQHFSGYFMKRSLTNDGPGITMDDPDQPAVRVSWQDAMAFCRWLSERSGNFATLPSEAQWEYACRAGSDSPLAYGGLEADFSRTANMADAALARIYEGTGGVVVLQGFPVDARFDDGAVATRDVGSGLPNVWGLFDMHGNAAEWTRSRNLSYPYLDDGREGTGESRRVVRGGSYHDRPQRCRSAFRWSYPQWQRVHDVGFRVVIQPPSDQS